jgi:two-component system, cell cycle sensor histidine kinase and response regulator CckA
MKALKSTAGFAVRLQNQLIPPHMVMRLKTPFDVGTSSAHAASREAASPRVLAIGAALSLLFVLLASQAPHFLLLAVLALLAACGLFFLLTAATGRIRIDSTTKPSVDDALLRVWPEAALVTTRLGTTVFANHAFDSLVPSSEGGGLGRLEAWFNGASGASEALFRMSRAGERGDTASEDLTLPTGGHSAADSRRTLTLTVCPLDLPQLQKGPLVLWRIGDTTAERGAAQHKSTAFEREAYHAAPVGILSVRTDGGITDLNETMSHWLNLPRAARDDDTLTLEQIFAPPGATLLRRQLERAEPFEWVVEVTTKAGAKFPVRVIAGASRAVLGLPTLEPRVLVVVRTASDTRPAMPNLEPTDLSFARHFQSAPFGIATIDAAGKITSANAAFAQIVLDGSGGVDDDAIAVLCRDATVDAKTLVKQSLIDAVTGRDHAVPVDFAADAKGEFGRRVYMVPLATGSHGGDAVVCYVIDTTEQKALEAKFAQSQKMEAVGKLAGGIAHDFNNVLTAIIGSADLMLQTHRASDAAHKDIQNIKQSANRAAGLVGKLMAFSRQQPMQLEALGLADSMLDLRQMLKTSLGEKIDLKISTDRDLWYVKGDRTQIDQVVVNLAVNARDAMPNGGSFTVRTRNITEREAQKSPHPGLPVAEFVLTEVEDTGSGMPADVLAKIFEPFFTTKEVGKGTGLGLATVYGIVKQLSGYIYAESVMGSGTIFRIYLPRTHIENEAEFVAQKAAKKEIAPVDLTGNAKVLVVEDEDMVRSVAVRSLTRLGYTVLEASNGYEALDIVAEQNGAVDIVISDVVMPEMDGPAFLKEVRKTNPDLRIIFVSGHTNDAFKTSLDENENFAFLPKPFSLPQLAAKVKEELSR